MLSLLIGAHLCKVIQQSQVCLAKHISTILAEFGFMSALSSRDICHQILWLKSISVHVITYAVASLGDLSSCYLLAFKRSKCLAILMPHTSPKHMFLVPSLDAHQRMGQLFLMWNPSWREFELSLLFAMTLHNIKNSSKCLMLISSRFFVFNSWLQTWCRQLSFWTLILC